MGFFCGGTWGIILAIWLVLSIVGCIVGSRIYQRAFCEQPYIISVLSVVAWLVMFVFTIIVNAMNTECGEVKDTFRENATIVEMHSNPHMVKVGKVWTTRTNYYMTIKGKETGHEEKFQIEGSTYDDLSEGMTVILDTNTICTKWTEEVEQSYDWETGTIK